MNLLILENFGCAVTVKGNTIFQCALLVKGGLDLDEGNDLFNGFNFGEVSAPESQSFLDEVNKNFGTSFTLEQF